MRKTVSMKLSVLLVALLTAPLPIVAESITHSLTYNFNNLTIGTDTLGGVTYSTVSYEGLYNNGVPGAPSLPVDYIRFSVPYNATNFAVSAVASQELISNIDYMVYPCQVPRTYNDTLGCSITPPNSAYYSSNFYPAEKARVVNESFLAGENHIVTVAVTPFSYARRFNGLFSANQLKKPLSLNLTLTYQTGETMQSVPIVRRDTVLRNEGFELTRSMVVNPDQVRENAVPDTSFYINYHGTIIPVTEYPVYTPATYLIVTTQELKHSTRRIAALKRQQGYSVMVVTMDEVIASPYSGIGDTIYHSDHTYQIADSSSAGKLRQYLKYCFRELGTKYVLLAGTDVPYQTKDLGVGYGITPSDMYYSELNSSWLQDTVEAGTDLIVGRILATTSSQIDNYTDKLFRYELNPGNGNYSYLDTAFFLKGRDVEDRLEYYQDSKILLESCYSDTIVVTDSSSNHSGWPTGQNVIDTLNHVSFAILYNHGGHDAIKVYGPDNNGSSNYIYALDESNNDEAGDGLDCLQNKDKPMVFYAPSCKTVPYDYPNGPVFGETFTTGKDYGGPVYIGYTRQAEYHPITEILFRFVKLLKNGVTRLGEADALSKYYAAPLCHKERVMHAYIGDPLVDLWIGIPQQFNNADASRTYNSITVSGFDIDSAIVAYCDNDGLAGYRIAPSSSVTLNLVSPNSTIMLYKHNCIPYILPLFLQNEIIDHDQYVIASDVSAGMFVESGRLPGNVIVKSGAEYEIEASGTVTLEDGFRVEKGATFAVYPACF